MGCPTARKGNPAPLLPGDSIFDLDLGPRIIHGRSDMGAYEYAFRTPVAAATATPAAATTGQAITFDGSGSTDPDPGDALSYAWSFDDGTTATGPVVTHAFATVGAHVATLTVTVLPGVAERRLLRQPDHDRPSARRSTTKTTHASTGAITIGKVSFAIHKGKSKTVSVSLTTVARGVIARTHRLSSSAATVARAGHGQLVSRNTTLTITPAPKPKAKKHGH